MKQITPSTKATKASEIERSWHLIDVKDQTLGRITTQIALALMGKSKTNFVRRLDCGDYVVVTNASHIVVTGKKEKEKTYGHYSGHPGGLKEKPLWLIRQENPTEIIRHAVYGMIPKNKLRDQLMTRLYIFAETDHPYKEHFQTK
jgi:large subunit ribosomal protein L13